MVKLHPRLLKAAAEHRARNEKQVKDEARARAESVSCFHVDQQLRVVAKGRHTITVAFFDGRSQEVTRTLEVACDDQYPDAIDILAEGEGE